MSTSRLPRGFSTFFRNCHNVDKAPDYKKGGYLRNIFVTANVTRLRPMHYCCQAGGLLFEVQYKYFKPIDGLGRNMTSLKGPFLFQTFSSKTPATSALSKSDLKKAIDHLTDQFMDARELLQDARESAGTVYFSSDMEEASESVTNTLQEYQELLNKLSDEQKQDVLRTIGLKMEELKAQQLALEEQS